MRLEPRAWDIQAQQVRNGHLGTGVPGMAGSAAGKAHGRLAVLGWDILPKVQRPRKTT